MSTSRLQDLFVRKTRYVFEPLGYDVIENFRPKWLKTESAQRPLEIDVFIPKLDAGIEIHGKQHFEHVPFFHETNEDFERALRLDMEKRIACAENEVFLFELAKEERVNEVIEKLGKLLPENPLGIKNANKYKYRKRNQIKFGGIISLAEYSDGDMFIFQHRTMKHFVKWQQRNADKITFFTTKLSKAPHGEEVYFRNLIERGMREKAIETFMNYGHLIHEFRK